MLYINSLELSSYFLCSKCHIQVPIGYGEFGRIRHQLFLYGIERIKMREKEAGNATLKWLIGVSMRRTINWFIEQRTLTISLYSWPPVRLFWIWPSKLSWCKFNINKVAESKQNKQEVSSTVILYLKLVFFASRKVKIDTNTRQVKSEATEGKAALDRDEQTHSWWSQPKESWMNGKTMDRHQITDDLNMTPR